MKTRLDVLKERAEATKVLKFQGWMRELITMLDKAEAKLEHETNLLNRQMDINDEINDKHRAKLADAQCRFGMQRQCKRSCFEERVMGELKEIRKRHEDCDWVPEMGGDVSLIEAHEDRGALLTMLDEAEGTLRVSALDYEQALNHIRKLEAKLADIGTLPEKEKEPENSRFQRGWL